MSGVLKNYVAFSRDHSGSMGSVARTALKDYNNTVAAIREASATNGQETLITVMSCGITRMAVNRFDAVHVNAKEIGQIDHYAADGSRTPLYDSILDIINEFKKVPDYKDPNVSFLVNVLTDGYDNASHKISGPGLGKLIQELQATDRWTFAFRVPKDGRSKAFLVYNGIPEGNILEWEAGNSKSMEQSTAVTQQAFTQYFNARSAGQTSSKSFYQADMSDVSRKEVKESLTDISSEVQLWDVTDADDGSQIRPFVEKQLGSTMNRGAAFYQLTKKEKAVQEQKLIVIRDIKTKAVYTGQHARDMIGLPHYGNHKVEPGQLGKFEVYIQSTSTNRKLVGGTKVLYWGNVGKQYRV